MADLVYKAQTRFMFHAHIKIKLSAFFEDEIFDELFAVLDEVDNLYNSYQPQSYISRINRQAGSFVEVDDETIRILKTVIELSDFFDGEYDITIMPLIRLWGFYKDEQRIVPSREEIERIKPLVNYKRIEIEGNKVRIGKSQEIITGSFIKAYAVDCLVSRMKQMGITDAIVNAGGSTIYAINDKVHRTWPVTAREPDNGEILFNLRIANQCYSTSSQANTFVEIDGQRYGHIISPKTGMPSTNKLIGIISESCIIGDIISTGLYNETPEGFLKKIDLLNKKYNVRGFLKTGNQPLTANL